MAIFWEIIFWSMRFHLEGPGLLFGLLSLYVIIKGYDKQEKIFGLIPYRWSIPLAAVLVTLTYGMRRAYFVFGIFIFFYILFTRPLKTIIKDKYSWIALAIGIAILFFLESSVFIGSITKAAGAYYKPDVPFTLQPLKVFASYYNDLADPLFSTKRILFYLFWAGLILILGNLALHTGHIKRLENREVKSDLLILITIIITLSYFLFYQKTGQNLGEPRWYYPLLFGTFICIARISTIIADYLKRYHKFLGIGVVIILLAFGGYAQVQHSDSIIKAKVNTYSGIKDAALYIKSISSPEDAIMSIPLPQPAYYAERLVINPVPYLNSTPGELSFAQVLDLLDKEKNIKYLIITFSEPNHPPWMRSESYLSDGRLATLSIPFMNTTIDLISNRQDIKYQLTYGNITFTLLGNKNDAFIYEISRTALAT